MLLKPWNHNARPMENISDFRTDLEFGQEAERILGGYLRSGSFEIKRDRLMHETGRLYIEWQSRGNRSGIAMDDINPIWLYCADDITFGLFMDASHLREAIKMYKSECEAGLIQPPGDWCKEGGDENTSRGALIDVHDLVRIMLSLVKPVNK